MGLCCTNTQSLNGYNTSLTLLVVCQYFTMDFNQQESNQNSIISVDNAVVHLSHTTLSMPCFISPSYHTQTPDLTLEKLDKTLLFPLSSKDDIDLLIIGTGQYSQFLTPQQQIALQQMNIGVESMPSESACRSFNLLLSDVRLVGLLLL